MIVMIHIEGHYDFVANHPHYPAILLAASYFIPEIVLLGASLVFATIILAIIGGSKSGFFVLLWQYLKALKHHICPVVHFGNARIEVDGL
jgi:hypothetical protein